LIVASGIALVATGAALAATTGNHGSHRRVLVEEPTTTAPSTTSPANPHTGTPAVAMLPSPALSPRSQAAMVWTGTSLAVWGGDLDAPNMGLRGSYRVFNDGSFYAPATRTWTPMAAAPLPASVDAPEGALTSAGVVFGRGRATALWDPATNAWRKLGDAPRTVTDMTFTGSAIVSYSANATLDVRSGVWRALPPPPLQLQRPTFAWTGRELVVVGGPLTPFTSAQAIAFDPTTREWRRITDPPADLHAEALSADWDGRRVVVVNYDMRAYAYDPAGDSWSALPAVPARFFEWYPRVRSAGGYTAAFMAGAIVVLTPGGAWVPLPYGEVPFGTIASTRAAFDARQAGAVLFVLGVRNNGTFAFASVDPALLVATAARLQVGIGAVRLPVDYRLETTHYDLVSNGIDVELGGPHYASCSVTSTYTGPSTKVTAPVRESLENDGAPTTWHRNAAGTLWQATPTTTDSFTIKCAGPAPARWLAASASFKIGK